MKQITIDTTTSTIQSNRARQSVQRARWTFLIDGEPIRIVGSYQEACATAKLSARLRGSSSNVIHLTESVPVGRIHHV